MEFLFLFFIFFGIGALLGLAYVGIKAIVMLLKGLIWVAREFPSTAREAIREGTRQGKADVARWEARKKERRRGRP